MFKIKKILKNQQLSGSVWKKTDNFVNIDNADLLMCTLLGYCAGWVYLEKEKSDYKLREGQFFFNSSLLAPFFVSKVANICKSNQKHLIVINSEHNRLVNDILDLSQLQRVAEIPNFIFKDSTVSSLKIYEDIWE